MRQPKSAHRKTQTPIVAKQVEIERGKNLLPHPISRNLHFYQILKNRYDKRRYCFSSVFRQKNTSFKIFNLFGSFIIPLFSKFVNPNCQKKLYFTRFQFLYKKHSKPGSKNDLECLILFNSTYTSVSNCRQSLQ